jgi:hypothetical protein
MYVCIREQAGRLAAGLLLLIRVAGCMSLLCLGRRRNEARMNE